MQKVIQIAGGISLLTDWYAPFFAVVLFPISVNVFLFHTILVPSGWLMGVLLLVPNLLLGLGYRACYRQTKGLIEDFLSMPDRRKARFEEKSLP
jgi:hypothetical protein